MLCILLMYASRIYMSKETIYAYSLRWGHVKIATAAFTQKSSSDEDEPFQEESSENTGYPFLTASRSIAISSPHSMSDTGRHTFWRTDTPAGALSKSLVWIIFFLVDQIFSWRFLKCT